MLFAPLDDMAKAKHVAMYKLWSTLKHHAFYWLVSLVLRLPLIKESNDMYASAHINGGKHVVVTYTTVNVLHYDHIDVCILKHIHIAIGYGSDKCYSTGIWIKHYTLSYFRHTAKLWWATICGAQRR